MPTVLQNIFRTICILLLTTFWSAVTLIRLLWEWWKYKDPSGRVDEYPNAFCGSRHPKNPLMVMLHGFLNSVFVLAIKNLSVVALDLRGYGETDKPTGVSNYDTETLAADVVEAIEKLGAMNRPDLIADRLIILNVPHPKAFMKVVRTKSTQLLKSWYIFLFQCPMLAELRIKANDFAFLEQIFRSSKGGGLVHPENFTDEDMEAWKYTFGTPNAITPPLNYYRAGMMVAGKRHFSGEPVRPKTLIIWELKIDARLEILEEASHWVQQDVPQQVNALIKEFIIQ
uniref:AB hydrolase-1 domain-containing protein n=1 Tax=Ditylenchus dipsaci TaxID=166011 RepID=A0A915ELG8_9BILA